MTDSELIHEYLCGSTTAFAELVQRHAGWVCAVARRRLGDVHLAEDVAQSVFLVLARKAPALRRQVVLSAWLFEVTRMTILRLQRDRIRRQRRETQAAMLRESSDDPQDANWRALEPLLDASVLRLRDRDRKAVLLRFYERKTFAEVGRVLGSTEEGARKLVTRAVDRLRAMLATHAAVVPAPALAALLWARTSQTASANLLAAILAEQARSGVIQLAKGAMLMMAWRKARLAILSAAATLFIATIGIAILQRPRAQAEAPLPSSPASAPALTFIEAAPILSVKNLPAAAEFYVDRLGFKMMWKYGEPTSLACVGRDKTSIYLSQAGDVVQAGSVYVHVSDVDAVNRQLSANGVTAINGPVNTGWGMREILVEDPDGNRLRIGSIYDQSALPSEKHK